MRIDYSQDRSFISHSHSNAFAADAGNDGLVEARRILHLQAGETHTFERSSQTDGSITFVTCAIRGLDKVIREL
jgi:hypothetical protein